ncbi:MAG: hypothetical protein BGO14_10450 [Chlamydiales bacterium 38-26]|nr:cupin domain-containing protein [Chlamydiales bacterium]OJV11376.1 MAG: hypothetical protein BGO14_10450 [Chlamydiales bacterium 38-26]
MGDKLFFDLGSIKPHASGSSGQSAMVTVDEMSGLDNIAFSILKLNKNGIQEPIWHPNANKIGYCVDGNALVSIRSPASSDMFTITKGDVFFIQKGYVHTITNIDEGPTEIIFALNHTKPQLMNLSSAVYSLSDTVFHATFKTEAEFFNGLKKNKAQEIIKSLTTGKGSSHNISSRYKFNIANSSKPVQTHGGYLQASLKDNLPVLDGLGILGFGLTPGGVVEPHWHTNAGELIYIIKGHTRVTVLGPDGHPNVLEVKAGQGAFAAASHFHNIENVGKEDVEVIAFFNHAEPDFIGIGEVIGSYSNEVLGSLFNVDSRYFDQFKKPSGPLIIVPI